MVNMTKEDISLLEIYMRGFNDALRDSIINYDNLSPIMLRAYNLGCEDFIFGDDNSLADYQTDEEILVRIYGE